MKIDYQFPLTEQGTFATPAPLQEPFGVRRTHRRLELDFCRRIRVSGDERKSITTTALCRPRIAHLSPAPRHKLNGVIAPGEFFQDKWSRLVLSRGEEAAVKARCAAGPDRVALRPMGPIPTEKSVTRRRPQPHLCPPHLPLISRTTRPGRGVIMSGNHGVETPECRRAVPRETGGGQPGTLNCDSPICRLGLIPSLLLVARSSRYRLNDDDGI
ncbi:hypothetical protein Bbelb_382590 [Branchiostoma belcheri]|nr:hypothetical protein Bbelb_382590 [Branchiostoma belcheri]